MTSVEVTESITRPRSSKNAIASSRLKFRGLRSALTRERLQLRRFKTIIIERGLASIRRAGL